MKWFTKNNNEFEKEAYLFLSDIHLTESEDHVSVWKNFKRSEHHADHDLAELIDNFEKDFPNHNLNIVTD